MRKILKILIIFLLFFSPSTDIDRKAVPDDSAIRDYFYHNNLYTVSDRHRYRHQDLNSYWATSPAVRVCENSGARKSRSRIIYDDNCPFTPAEGEITITIVTNEISLGQNLAVTRSSWYTESRQNLKSIIYVMPSTANRPLLLEHELGHALGWRHKSQSYHVMNPDYDRLGHRSAGVSYRDYLHRINHMTEIGD